MRRVFKPQNVISNQGTVKIPDVVFKEDPKPLTDENGEPEILTEEVYEKIRAEIREEMAGEIRKKKLEAAHERDIIIGNAKKEAKKLVEDAVENRRSILDDANDSASQIRNDAHEEGLQKGITEKSDILEKLAEDISQSIEQLKNDENEYFEEYEKQLKYIAFEIAEKIIYQKIQEDDMIMYNLVKSAIKSARNAAWIKAEVSGKLSGYIDSLEKELADNGIKAEIVTDDNAPDDMCVVNTSDGVVVATVSQQLANLKEFISIQDKGGNDD